MKGIASVFGIVLFVSLALYSAFFIDLTSGTPATLQEASLLWSSPAECAWISDDEKTAVFIVNGKPKLVTIDQSIIVGERYQIKFGTGFPHRPGRPYLSRT